MNYYNLIDKHMRELNEEALDLWEIPTLELIEDESKNSKNYKKLRKIARDIKNQIQIKTELLGMTQDSIKGLEQIDKWDRKHQVHMSWLIQKILK